MTQQAHSSPDPESNERTTKAEDFICPDDELGQIVKYYVKLQCELNYCKIPDYEAVLEDSTECEVVLDRRISKIAEILGKDTVNDIVEKTTNVFNRKMGASFDRNYTALAVDKLKEYKKA